MFIMKIVNDIKWIFFTIFPFLERKYDVYLAGPMKGFVDSNFPAFRLYASKLRKAGYRVWNPAENEDSNMSYEQCMRLDLDAVVNKCRSVVLLPGEAWKNSVGASAEVTAAHVCGKGVFQIVDTEKGGISFKRIQKKSVKPYLD